MSEVDFQQGLLTGLSMNDRAIPRSVSGNDIVISEEILLSAIRFNSYSPESTTYDDDTTQYSYSEIVTEITALETAYPSNITIVDIGDSFGGDTIHSMEINNTGSRPVIGFSLGIHGNERAVHDPLFEWIKKILDATTGIMKNIADTFTIIVLPTVNPDGMIADTRNNDNSVNLNRNWPYYWDAEPSTDKGASASSEPETQNIQDYLNTNDLVGRVLFWADIHGWNTRTTWGWLTEQIYHDIDTAKIQRCVYTHMLAMNEQVDYSGFTIVNTSPVLTEYHSARKPYLYTWVKNRALEDAYCCIFEYPQSESVGLCCEFFYHMLEGIGIGIYDYYTSSKLSGSVLIDSAIQILNNNYTLRDWNISEERPNWFTKTGLRLEQKTDVDEGLYVESLRAVSSSWGHEVAYGAFTNFTGSKFFICGGKNVSGTLALAKGQNEIDKSIITLDNLPTGLVDSAACNDGTYMYVVGGYNAGYKTEIYRIEPGAVTPAWSTWSNLATGRQRHTCHIYDGYLWIIGGRSSTAYLNDIRRINLSTKAESSFGTFTTARGWHTSCIYNGYLYIVGGWSGSTARGDVRKINLSTGAETNFSLPSARRLHGMAQNGSIAYILCGDDGSASVSTLWKLDMSSDAVTAITYTLDNTYDEDGNLVEIPEPDNIGVHAFYNADEDLYTFIGGEDSSGNFTAIAYEYDVSENTLFQREANQNTWGYIRASSAYSCVTGEKYSINIRCRNEADINDTVNPYIRIMVLTGPLSSIIRKIRSQYTVPPQEFADFSLAFEIEAGETEFRIYVRHYGNNTKIGINRFLLLNSNINGITEVT